MGNPEDSADYSIMAVRLTEKFVSKADLAALLRAYENGTAIVDGGLRYASFDYFVSHEVDEILPDAFAVSPPISRSKAVALFRRALRETRMNEPLTAEAVRQRAEQIDAKDRAVRMTRYTMWTKFRASNMAHSPGFKLRWAGVSFRTASTLPKGLHLTEYFMNGFGQINPENPLFYGHLVTEVLERDGDTAATRMLDATQLVMGLFNLYEGYGRWSWHSGRARPHGMLWQGPYQFLFRGRKPLTDRKIWYNPEFVTDDWSTLTSGMKDVLKLVPRVRDALTKLDTHPLKDTIVKSILLMQDAFSSKDENHRLLRYWSALERLYVEENSKEKSNQKVIERAAFAEENPRLAQWRLAHISRLRNEYVHAGVGAEGLDAMGQFLRALLSRHLNHWIFKGDTIPNHSTLIKYVSLPHDVKTLRDLRDVVDRRIELVELMQARRIGT